MFKCKEKLPAYSVKGYSLVLSKTYDYKSKPRMQKDIPELAPGEITELKFSSKDYKVLTIIRPTGFSITQVEL